ncbi:MAG: LysR family transcriptional regulator [Rhodobacter sp.]|jgi:DNA-binding transcriptional LysR family regulator|nr:LysR family transcriptional regulator [Rhodobacter sp.]
MARISAPERLARDLDWNLLRVFLALAEAGSVTGAAERLSLKQPSVSAALKRLEARVQIRLIDRARGHFALTAAGERMLAEALEVRAAILRLADRMAQVEGQVTGHVTIALASHVVSPLFDATLAAFHRDHPAATLTLEVMASRDALATVAARRASLALCLMSALPPGVKAAPFYRESFGLFCGRPHPLYGRRDLAEADLSGLPAVSFQTDREGDVLETVTALRRRLGLGDRVTGSSANLEEVRRLIELGIGVGPLPLHVVAADVEAGRLWQLPPYTDLPTVDVFLCHAPALRMNPAEAALLARLQEALARTPFADRTYGTA